VLRLFSVGLIAAFSLAATACGVNPDPSDVGATGLTAADSARVETVTRVSVVGSDAATFEFRSTSIVDYVRDRRQDQEESSGCRTITIGDVTYGELRSDEGFPAGKRWVKSGGETIGYVVREQSQEQTTSTNDISTSTSVVGYSMLDPAPDKYLDYLRDNSGEPERVGHEEVRGVSTTRYRSTIDVGHGIRIELEGAGEEAANVDRSLEEGASPREIDVWIDSEGRARRVVTTDRSPGAEVGMTSDWVTTTEFFDFGLETDIQPPPAAEVLDSEEWQRIVEEQMREEMDEFRDEMDEGLEPLPGSFSYSTGADSGQPASCLH
jgi:hypothetical protein